MDLTLLLTIASGLVVLIVICVLFIQKKSSKDGDPQPQARVQAGPAPRRAQIARNARNRMRAQAAHQDSDSENDDPAADPLDGIDMPKGKVGTKKLAKLQAKAERKAQLESEDREREERKKRQQAQEEERLKASEREAAEEKRCEEEEKKAREEQERCEYEEYLKMKAAFSVEEEGFEDGEADGGKVNLLQEFVNYIKDNKVVVLEDLAAHFKLKTQNVIDRIQDLQNDGALTGVVDDRGKFIYISQGELESVAKFVKQRGRVSITDLAESSNQLINLNPTKSLQVSC